MRDRRWLHSGWALCAGVLGACGTSSVGDDASAVATTAGAACGNAPEHTTLTLSCPAGQTITAVTFASYGTPAGSCGSFRKGTCDASNSTSIVSAACLGQSSCTVRADNAIFGDPCRGKFKHLDAQVTCSAPTRYGGTPSDSGADADADSGHDSGGASDSGTSSSCNAAPIRITEIDVGAAIDTNEDDASSKVIMLSAIPSGGSRLMWNGADGKVHVTTLDADDTVNANAGAMTLPGADAEDIYADDAGGVVLLTRDAQGGGTLNCGNPANLCGTAPNPPIACSDMYMVRFDGTKESWATKLTQSSPAHPPYLNGPTDGNNVIFVWWYAHQGRIVSDGTNFGAYFGSAISVSQGGCVNIHQGDTMKVVSPAGAIASSPDSFDWGCSHSGYERIVWDPVASKYVMTCKNDTPTDGKSGQIAYPPGYPYATMTGVDLFYDNVGNLVLGGGGGYWLTASDIRPGQTPSADGLADVHLFHFAAGARPDVDHVLASTPGANDRAPHLAKYGDNMLAVWEQSPTSGDLAFRSSDRAMYLQVLNGATGTAIGAPLAVASTGGNAIYGNRYQEFKSYPDGSVAYASAGSGPSKLKILRVLPCH